MRSQSVRAAPTPVSASRSTAQEGAVQAVAGINDAQPYFKADGIGDGSDDAGANARATGTAALAIGSGAGADERGFGRNRRRRVRGRLTDAVNVNQLARSMNGAVNQANSYTDDKVRSARRDAYGGTASALAVAGLPQAMLPGHGMVAATARTYGGQSAVALGVSQLSGTGKWTYKVQGTTSSRGEFGASIGAGMHW